MVEEPRRGGIARLLEKVAMQEARRDLNRLLRGCSNYFSYGIRLHAYRAVDSHVYERVRHFLRRRHKVPTRGTRRFGADTIFGEVGVLRLRTEHVGARP